MGVGRRSAAALAAVAVLSAGCGASEPVAEPSAPRATASSSGGSATSSATAPATPSPTPALAGAAADVPRAEIMRQLARRAERIAKKIPMAPAPTDVDPGSNRAIGYQEMVDFGFGVDQWPYLDALWQRESGWNHLAENPSSGAYGIPQSLPATKMAVVGSDWRTNPVTQIRWGLAYIAARYGSAQEAWAHSERVGWY